MQKMLAFPRPAANSQNSLSPAWLLAALPERSVGRCSAIMGIVDRPQKKLEPPGACALSIARSKWEKPKPKPEISICMFHANTSSTPTFVNNSRKPQSLAVRQASNLPFAQVGEPNRTQTKSARDLHRPDGWLHKDLSSPSHISYIHRSTISPSICTQQMSRTSPCATAARISKTPSNHYVSLPRPITSIAPMQLSCSPKRPPALRILIYCNQQ
jgi:hypothetical protein